MNPIIEKYLELLWNQFQYDVDVLSHPWMYYWALVPAICYILFFFAKWTVLTTPIWLPPSLILQSFTYRRGKKKQA